MLKNINVICFKEADNLVIDVQNGKVRGHVLKSERGENYYAFQQIPYAASPVGKDRFKVSL